MVSLSGMLFETKLAKKLQNKFVKISKRNQLLARWAFRKTNLSPDKRKAYVYDIIKSYLLIPNDNRLVDNIVKDLSNRGVDITKREVYRMLKKIKLRLGI